MKKMIYYFSGTGNSLYVAKKIQEQLGEVELIQITSKERDKNPTITANVLGFVFPVYAWGPPKIVEEFLNTAGFKKPGYLFVVATHGGGPGNTLKYTKKLLKKRGLSLDGAFEIQMPANYISGSNPPSPEKAASLIETQRTKLAEICSNITEKRKKTAAGDGMLKSALIHPIFNTFAGKQQAKKFSTSEQCTSCGVCEKLCPVENISLNSEKKPEWGTTCEVCMGCINLCPAQAIESGNVTKGRNRYQNPEIQVKELFT